MKNNLAIAQPLEQKIIHFPNGLIGLENYQKFVIKEVPDQEFFSLLQSLEDEHFGMVITSPFWFMPEYEFDLADEYMEQLGDKANLEVFVTVTLGSTPEKITANLMGPIVLDQNVGIGFQVLASDQKYTTRYDLLSAKLTGG